MTKIADSDVVPSDWQPVSDLDKAVMGLCTSILLKASEQLATDFHTLDGGPQEHANALVGLVIVAGRLEEEKVVAMLDLIERVGVKDY